MRKSYVFGWMLMISGFAYGQDGAKEVTICAGTSLRLKAESAGAEKFEWYHNNQLVQGAVHEILEITEEGSYRAVAVIDGACKSDASLSVQLNFRVPVATNDFASGKSGTELTVDLLQNDVSACNVLDPASIVIKRLPEHGTLEKKGLSFIYTPDAGFNQIDTFTYTVKDVNGKESNEATVKLDLTPPLPVTLIDFRAEKEESTSLLTWSTTSETNSSRFDPERSADGKTWVKIGVVMAAQNSSEKLSYSFVDSLPESGINYYRLKAVDLDETFAYSRIQSVHFPEFAWAEVFPNPVSDELQIVIRNGKVKKMKLVNLSGQTLYSSIVSGRQMKLSMKNFQTGFYFIHLEQENGKVSVFKIMH